MRYLVLALVMALAVPAVWGVTLQSVYDQAGPGEGYDKLLILDPNVTYTGGCGVSQGKKSCIRGNGAVLDLQHNQIYCGQPGTEVTIEGCCLINGAASDAAITVLDGAVATLDGNTFAKNYISIKIWLGSSATIKNNIVYGNSWYGVAAHQNSYGSLTILYNDFHNNGGGNYMYWCSG